MVESDRDSIKNLLSNGNLVPSPKLLLQPHSFSQSMVALYSEKPISLNTLKLGLFTWPFTASFHLSSLYLRYH